MGDLLLGILSLADVDQQIEAPDEPAAGIEERRRKWHERDAAPIRPLGLRLDAPDGPALAQRNRHRALIMRQMLTVLGQQAVGNAPEIRANARFAAGKLGSSAIEVGQAPIGIRDIDGSGKLIENARKPGVIL